jgi:hypothetical protein
MTTLLERRMRWPMPRVALYWRRRRAARTAVTNRIVHVRTARTTVTNRIVHVRTAQVSRVSVHQHVLRVRHSPVGPSPAAAATTTVVRVAAPSRVSERIVVRRLLEVRPLDARPPAAPQAQGPAARVLHSAAPAAALTGPAANAAADPPRGVVSPDAGRRERTADLRRERTVETRHVLTERARQELNQVTRTERAADRWVRQRVEAVRLEWRTTPPSPGTRAGHSASAPPPAGDRSRPAAASAPPATAAAPAIAAAGRGGPPPASAPALDRAALDRLADDVLQRIERRVRIERERRGL